MEFFFFLPGVPEYEHTRSAIAHLCSSVRHFPAKGNVRLTEVPIEVSQYHLPAMESG